MRYISLTSMAINPNKRPGEFPVGAYFGRGTPNTANLLPIMWKEMGHKMLYTSEVYNEDSPYWIDLPWEKDLPEEEKEGLLMVPYNYDCEYPMRFSQKNKDVNKRKATMGSSICSLDSSAVQERHMSSI